MTQVLPLQGIIKPYKWGSRTAIPELLGVPSEKTPQAELWLGAHPTAPSRVKSDGVWNPLTEMIESAPDEILGRQTALAFNNSLPFLFKVLAAAKPLSIQAHPNEAQARSGFDRETAAGIPLDARNRNYKDRHHKPECICALTRFWALNGFRKIEETIPMLRRICPVTLAPDQARLNRCSDHREGVRTLFEGLMSKSTTEVDDILKEAVGNAEAIGDDDPAFSWLLRLYREYPRDIGVLSPVFLNLICLNPGEALYLSAGRLHAYLDGVGIELMANSDNVLRGGLTSKHIDLPELLGTLSFEETEPEVLKPVPSSEGERVYATPAREFALSEISLKDGVQYRSSKRRSIEILLCVKGEARGFDAPTGAPFPVRKGESILIPASLDGYRLEGDALLYKASVGNL